MTLCDEDLPNIRMPFQHGYEEWANSYRRRVGIESLFGDLKSNRLHLRRGYAFSGLPESAHSGDLRPVTWDIRLYPATTGTIGPPRERYSTCRLASATTYSD
ncbi:hypothetical protein BTZ20_0317 [Rhodococcus sp. MTM3W5.2]|nr:hypothetical protein BTZ20_0317 [Rhodococcus sp. MTM3W5.2]